jgi:hypothetical protein
MSRDQYYAPDDDDGAAAHALECEYHRYHDLSQKELDELNDWLDQFNKFLDRNESNSEETHDNLCV